VSGDEATDNDGRYRHHYYLTPTEGAGVTFKGCDRAIPKILIGRESDILSDKSNSYELLGKDIKIAG